MHRFEEKRPVRIWGLGIAVALTIMTGAVSSSCVFGTKTNFCEQFDLRCREGQECAADQAVCVDIGGCGNGVVDQSEVCDDGRPRFVQPGLYVDPGMRKRDPGYDRGLR